ncbi:hypothetical protein NEOLEDRAFT_1136202 [Neolentinus lepideus HHB14362 ss-1]|uniref:Uncharacterized protein n=1 Tax=Neolentinus lepideus HHB14362 ss-1 TaxID=1314782 RepID=A0A165REQ7_9AGAM|nr:hypothetical protein NEOLEDRAFT_1136202 [Neolentinus lepideus HHB14362 ss-1]
MPHKRAKRSTREKEKHQRGSDLAPREAGVSSEAVPKAMVRVLNAAKIQSEYRKRKNEEKDRDEGSKKKRRKVGGEAKADKADMQILPGESLSHFNRRVEDAMRPLVRSAVEASSALERKTRKEMLREKTESNQTQNKPKQNNNSDIEQTKRKPSPSKTEFATLSTSQPKRLNDIAQAPPQFTRVPKTRKVPEESKTYNVLSMAQKQMMEEEREKVIKRYRDMKEKKLRDNGKLWTEESEGKAGT